jgi:hypothetical protein
MNIQLDLSHECNWDNCLRTGTRHIYSTDPLRPHAAKERISIGYVHLGNFTTREECREAQAYFKELRETLRGMGIFCPRVDEVSAYLLLSEIGFTQITKEQIYVVTHMKKLGIV